MQDDESTSLSARRWSEQILDFSNGVDRITSLKYLTEFDYVLPADQVDALQILNNPTGLSLRSQTLERADLKGRRDHLTLAVAAFARSYFETSPSERRRQWETLYHQCDTFPDLRRRLDALAPALSIERIPPVGDEVLNRLVEVCCRVFVARDPERARQRQEFILLYCQDPFRWLAAIRRLLSTEPGFVEKVAPWLNNLPNAINPDRDQKKPLSPILKPVQPKSTNKETAWNGSTVAVIMIISVLIRAMLRFGHTTDDRSPPRSYQSRTEFQFDQDEEQKKLRDGSRLLHQILEQRLRAKKIEMTPFAPGLAPSSPDTPPDVPPPPAMPDE